MNRFDSHRNLPLMVPEENNFQKDTLNSEWGVNVKRG
jgi:hypothetical protein